MVKTEVMIALNETMINEVIDVIEKYAINMIEEEKLVVYYNDIPQLPEVLTDIVKRVTTMNKTFIADRLEEFNRNIL